MDERQFHAMVDRWFIHIEASLEAHSPEVEAEAQEGLLTIFLPQGGALVLSRQTALREVWLASPRGAFHFTHHAGEWISARGESLSSVLTSFFSAVPESVWKEGIDTCV